MPQHLTAGQRARIEAMLTLRQHELDARVATHQVGQGRPEYACDALLDGADDARQAVRCLGCEARRER
jgi:hypothetical protein